MPHVGECALCREQRELCCSHILPKFVFRWKKKTAVGGIRQLSDPNRRIQDGWKEPLLCRECEERFQKVETPFAERVFVPVHYGTAPAIIPYEDWALRFAVSVSWRVLVTSQRLGLGHVPASQMAAIEKAEEAWRAFLLGHEPHPGPHEQHMLIVTMIDESTMGKQSGHLNTYLYRAGQVDLLANEHVAYTYAKMGRIHIVGFIDERHRKKWKGTKISLRRGRFDLSGRYGVPEWLWSYWNEKAEAVGNVHDQMSERQRKVVRDTLKKNAVEFLGSETWLAQQVDLGLDPDRAHN